MPSEQKKGKINIQILSDQNNILISVEDNGRGLTTLSENSGLNHSLENIKARFEQLEKMRLQGFSLKISNKTNRMGKIIGTQALVIIKKKTVPPDSH